MVRASSREQRAARIRLATVLLLLAAASGGACAACLPVTGNRILGRDLALADSRFSALPRTLAVGFAPAPGARRIFDALELQRIARANGIHAAGFEKICFEIPMVHLKEEDVLAAMRRALPADAHLRIVEMPAIDAPAGQIEFPLEALEPASPLDRGVQRWRGSVKYAGTRQFAVWARVEITVPFAAVVASRDLPAGAPIQAGSLRVESRTGPLDRGKPATRIEDVAGHLPRRAIKAGSVVPLSILAAAPVVRRGDPVPVEVESGRARLHFEAVAVNSAREGEMVELRNPASGKMFRARIGEGPKALVVVAPGERP